MRPSTPTTSGRRRRGVALIGIIAGAIAAVGVPAAVSASTSPPAGDYCQAQLDLEAAISSGDPSMIEPAAGAATDAAPPEVADALATMGQNAPTDGPPSPEYSAAHSEVVAWVKDNCGFTTVDVLAVEDHDADPSGVYTFGGLPAELPAGPAVMSLTNNGVEVHEMILVRRNEGVTDPVMDLLNMPEEEVFTKVTPVNQLIAFPGETSSFIVDLTPGNYIVVCFFPSGNTPEQMLAEMSGPSGSGAPGASGPAMSEAPAAAMTEPTGTMDMAAMGSAPPDSGAPIPGAPHAFYGMVQEFTVVDGAAAPATTG